MPREQKHYYVTTPIYYANGRPHLGNTYTTTLADMLSRFYRFLGYQTFFLTGTDEHGDKVEQAAKAEGKTAQAFTDEVSQLFRDTWKDFDFQFSRFIRTTDADHKKLVLDLLAQIHKQGDIYFGEYEGLYCVGCERFLTEKELVDGKCPDHQTKPQVVKEQNYFFRMSKYQDALLKHIHENPDFIRPERYKNEALAMLREPLEDLCISRPKSRLTWGIELPFDSNYVTYVWFDALINYLTGVGYPKDKNFSAWWGNTEHLIAKDILKPHGVFWPTMLLAAGIPLYKHLTVHGYWITATGKMSKSLGNVINPIDVKREFGMDVFRYFVFREMAFGVDGTFTWESLQGRYNADLANNLGNLVSRSLAMVHRYRQGSIPRPGKEHAEDMELQQNASQVIRSFMTLLENREINKSLETLWSLIDSTNVYIDRTKPWSLAKEETGRDPNASEPNRLDTVLYYQLEVIRIVASLLTGFMPETSAKILTYLGFDSQGVAQEQTFEAVNTWGRLSPGTKVQTGESLFPRKDTEAVSSDRTCEKTTKEKKAPKNKDAKMEQPQATPAATTAAAAATDALISYDDFARVQLRVGQIVAAEKIEKSEKLLKLQVDLGEPSGPRQIVAGIAKFYKPEELIGRKVSVVANLKPAKLMGQQSNGMILAASDELGNLELVTPGPSLSPGSIIK